ncbi:MAG TPA: hypothetical protein DD384_02540, partial [Firmicutes bacterium]|nr:hypothetical protein [Bacillota bacterium]
MKTAKETKEIKTTKTAKKKTAAKAKKEDDELFDPSEEKDPEEVAGMEAIKKEFLKRAKENGSINQQEIYDYIDKNRLELEDNDVQELMDYFAKENIKIINGDETPEASEPTDEELMSESSDDDMDEDVEDADIDDDFLNVQSGDVKVNDSVKMYLKDIGQYQLLTVEEEQ